MGFFFKVGYIERMRDRKKILRLQNCLEAERTCRPVPPRFYQGICHCCYVPAWVAWPHSTSYTKRQRVGVSLPSANAPRPISHSHAAASPQPHSLVSPPGPEVWLQRGHTGCRRPVAAEQAPDRPHQPAHPTGKHRPREYLPVPCGGAAVWFGSRRLARVCYFILFQTRTKRAFGRLCGQKIPGFYFIFSFQIGYLILFLNRYFSNVKKNLRSNYLVFEV